MKIIAGNSFGTNIEMVCDVCRCIYQVESREDWSIQMVRPTFSAINCKIPEYSIKCPNCGYTKFLGFDSDDLKKINSENFNLNLSSLWVSLFKKRSDWEERYKVK